MSEQTTALTAVQRQETRMIPVNGIGDIKELGAILGQSGMFGCKTEAEAVMIAAMCHQDGISYSKWMDTNHMINGRKTKRADAIHADFLRSGGKSRILKRDADGSIIELTSRDGDVSKFSLSWADALQEPFVYIGNESAVVDALINKKTDMLKIKPKYQTPLSRKQMLWARCISDSVRAVDPTCCQGVYTPEEVGDFDHEPQNVSPEDVKRRVASRAAEAKQPESVKATVAPRKKKEDYIDVDAEVVEDTPAPVKAEPVKAEAAPVEDPRAKAKAAAQAKIKEKSEAVEPKKAEPVAPAPKPKAVAVEPTPFDDPVAPTAEAEEDFNICPIFGRLQGKPWSSMDKATLEYAKKMCVADLTPQHIAAIDEHIAAIDAEIAKK